MNRVFVLLSGGVDSTTLLYYAVRHSNVVSTISFDYGQRHGRELECARYHAQKLNVRHDVINLRGIFDGVPLTGTGEIPSGHYTDASMKQTVVPNRNMVFLSIAIARAIYCDADAVEIAAHADDHGTYPDCRPEFIRAMDDAALLCDYHQICIRAPFQHKRKRDIVTLGRDLGIDYDKTWSCYVGGEVPCGKCGACSARMEALAT